ncbi:22872_t:CDS:1, partial [Dentiscutata erythropus]
FVKTSSDRKKPIEVFDPDIVNIKDLFFTDEPFFPIEEYQTQDYLFKLRELGMKRSMTGTDLIDRIEKYKSRLCDDEIVSVHNKSFLLLKYIDKNYQDLKDDILFREKLQTETWIPTLTPEPDNQRTFSKASDCRDNLYIDLISYTLPIVDYKIVSDKLRQSLGWDTIPPTEIVIKQLLHLVNLMNQPRKHSMNNIRNRINTNYEHFNKIINQPDGETHLAILKQNLAKEQWILNESDDNDIYTIDEVVFSLHNFIPSGYWVQLSRNNRINYSTLFEKLGVKKTLDIQDFIRVLRNVNFSKPKQRANIMSIIDELSKSKEENLTGLLIPNMNCEMVDYKIVLFDDLGSRENDSMKDFNIIAHSEISKNLAKRLKLENLSEVLLKNSKFDFGQHEQVTTRLKNILR